jgi:HAD superfamily hydrolase (TIGR01490 family)
MVKRGYVDQAAFLAIKESRMAWKNRNHPEAFKSYEKDLIKFYESQLKSIKPGDFSTVANDVFSEYRDQVYVYSRNLIADLKSKGYLVFAISGSQTEIVQKIADYYGFDDVSGAVYVQKGGRFTGEVILPHLHKDKVIKELVKKHGTSWKGSYAIGDSLGDAKMMDLVENPIAFNPEKKLFDYAKSRGWKIVIERKNMVYELEATDGKYQLV